MWDMSPAEETELPYTRLAEFRARPPAELLQAELARQTCNDRNSGYLPEYRFIFIPVLLLCTVKRLPR